MAALVIYKETGDKNVIDTHHFKPERTPRHLFVAKGQRKLFAYYLAYPIFTAPVGGALNILKMLNL
jgi:hypothetical protein